MKRPLFEKIFSYLLSAGLSSAVLVLGLALIYQSSPKGTVAVAEETGWPAPFELSPGALTGRAAVVYDSTTGEVLYQKNADMVLPLASLTKLIAAQAVLAHRAELKRVAITQEALEKEGDWGFWLGEEWPLDDLIRFSLTASSNDAIAAVAAGVLGEGRVDVINSDAHDLGFSSTQVYNSTGLDVTENQAGGYGTALDVAKLTAYFLKEYPTFFESTAAPSISISNGARTLTASSTATPLLDMPGLIGAKTGFTDLAGGNLVAAFDLELGHPVVIAVLGSTRQGRFEDVKTLLEAVRKK